MAAKFKLLGWSVNLSNPEIYITDVLFTFEDASTLQVAINHFRPTSVAQMRLDINNRGVTEWDRKVAIAAALQAGQALNPHINAEFPFDQETGENI